MAETTYLEALNQALKEEMRRDDNVVMWGEDVVSMNNVHGQTVGIFDEFGGDRIKDTPICEQAIAGMCVGAAYRGLRPIGIFMNAAFSLCAFDGVFLKMGCQGASFRSGSGLPVVVYGTIAGPIEDDDHGMSPEALFMHAPYLKIVMPSNAYDVKGLMKSAIRDDGPVVFWDHAWNFFMGCKDGEIQRGREATAMEVPEEEYLIPIGKADIKREGSDVTLVSWSFQVNNALAAAAQLEKDGISVEIVDLRSLVPLDIEAIVNSVKKTGRLVVVHEAKKRGGPAGEIICRVNEAAPDVMASLKSPFKRVTGLNLPLSRRPELVPGVDSIVSAVKEMV